MIIPRLHRRSLARAAQWRLLLLFWAALQVPALLAIWPAHRFLSRMLDHAPRARELVAFLDGATLLELLRQLGEDGQGAAISTGFLSGLIVIVAIAPFVAGAMVTVARSDEPLSFSRLLSGAGEHFGRMLRAFFTGLLPLGLAAAAVSGVFGAVQHLNGQAIWETDAIRRNRLAAVASVLLVFVFHQLNDLTRAQFAADPSRRSALRALWSSVRLVVRRPLRVFATGAVTALCGLLPAFALMALRLRVTQSSAPAIALAWLLAQLAVVFVGWGRAARLIGFAELIRADALDRTRRKGFEMEPPVTSPPPPGQESSTLAALSPPPQTDLSPPDGSAT